MTSSNPMRWLLVAFASLLAGCGPFLEDMAENRRIYAEAGKGPIVVAVVVDDDDGPGTHFVNGVRLALRDVNASDEGLLGRRMEMTLWSGSDNYDEARPTVRRIAADPRTIAVLGHRHSRVAIPASVVYEKAQVLFLSPFATSEALTRHGFDFTLRMLPDARFLARQIASAASLFGYERMAVLHSREDRSRWATYAFEEAARKKGINIVFRGPFSREDENYRPVVDGLGSTDVDAIFLATDADSGARMLKQLRELEIRQPVLASGDLNVGPLEKLAGSAGDLAVVPTMFDRESIRPSVQHFVRGYREAYGIEPDQMAAQGYDSIQVLKTIIERSGSTEPRTLATKAHFSGPIAGLTGIYAFDQSGMIFGNSFLFEVLRSEHRLSLPKITIPFLTASFQSWLEERRAQPWGLAERWENSVWTEPARETTASGRAPAPVPATDEARQPGVDQGKDASRSEDDGEPPASSAGSWEAVTDVRKGVEERNQAWLSLMHEILEFEHLGLVAAPTQPGGAAAIALARSVGQQHGFEVEVCALPKPAQQKDSEGTLEQPMASAEIDAIEPAANSADSAELRNAALRCYALLANSVDALYVLTDSGLSPDYLNRLNRGLRRFNVPTFAVGDSIVGDYGLTFAVVASDIDLKDPKLAFRFNGLLKDRSVHQLNRKLSRLPTVAVDLEALQELGLRPDPRSLTVASEVLESKMPDQPLALTEESE